MKPISFLLSAVCLLLSAPASAAVPDGTIIHPAALQPLAQWVSQHTGIRITALPNVVASGMRLKTSLGLEGIQQARSVAAYLPGQIIINNVLWDDESVRSVSYLVHEMVHHAQTLSAKPYPCNAAKEREAYELQNTWLVQHGEEPVNDADWINEISSCRKS